MGCFLKPKRTVVFRVDLALFVHHIPPLYLSSALSEPGAPCLDWGLLSQRGDTFHTREHCSLSEPEPGVSSINGELESVKLSLRVTVVPQSDSQT